MESTGVYWIAPHEVLDRYGFEVVLVNTRELANVLSTLAPNVLSSSCTKSARAEEDGSGGLHNVLSTLAPVDTTSAQLRSADGIVPAAGTGMHVAHIGSRQEDLGSRGKCAFNSCTGGLVAADAEMGFQLLPQKPGPAVQELKAHYECARAPGGIGHRRRDGHGHHARNCSGRAGCPAVGEVAECALLEERGGNRRTIERALAGGPLIMRFQLLRR